MCETKDYPIGTKITGIITETHDTKTFILDKAIDAKPGQFVMVWIPGIDEKPFTITEKAKHLAITVKKKGKATQAMHNMKKGDILGIRGPYGDGTFDLTKKKENHTGRRRMRHTRPETSFRRSNKKRHQS